MSYAGPENVAIKTEDREEGEDRPPYDDATMLQMVRVEMQRSIGFENDQALRADRLRALDYYKGDMKADIPSLPNRSRAVSSDIADAVETILPDIMEIFTAGGDVAVFEPVKPGDEDAARLKAVSHSHGRFGQIDLGEVLELLARGVKDGSSVHAPRTSIVNENLDRSQLLANSTEALDDGFFHAKIGDVVVSRPLTEIAIYTPRHVTKFILCPSKQGNCKSFSCEAACDSFTYPRAGTHDRNDWFVLSI